MYEGGSWSGGREGKLRKGTSEGGTQAWTKRRKEGREEASGGRREQRSEGQEKGRSVGGGAKGEREGGNLQGRYPEEDTGQYTLYSRERTKQHTTRPLPLRLWYYGYCDAS